MTLSTQIFTDEKKLQLMKDTICKGSNNDEFQLFIYTCKRLGLDPFARQIYPVKRWDSELKRQTMTIQTGIDGYRLIADRTGKYSPGRSPIFQYDDNGHLICATAFVKKQTPDGVWHDVEASAHYREYVGLKKDGKPNSFWATKPHIMLAKCAEALALRKAFPAELSGVYTKEEMEQADNPVVVHVSDNECSEEEKEAFIERWSQVYDIDLLNEYLEKRSAHFDKTVNETILVLMDNEEGFTKEIDKWIAQNFPVVDNEEEQ